MNKNVGQYNNMDIEKSRSIINKFLLDKRTIHILITKDRKKKDNVLECEIKGVYPRFFMVKYIESERENSLSIAYADIMIKNIVVKELDNILS